MEAETAMDKAEPPFRQGEWVIGKDENDAPLVRVKRLDDWSGAGLTLFVHCSPRGCYEASKLRRATARELRSESRRLAAYATTLAEAAGALAAKRAIDRMTDERRPRLSARGAST